MMPFWIMLLVPLWAVLSPRRLPARQASVVWWLVAALFAILIGLRHEVGADWFNYLPHFHRTSARTLEEIWQRGDPGYYTVNWLVDRVGGGIYGVNLFCAVVLMCGTVVFCRRQPNPWMALLAAVPYMLIVVGMGYTRQSVALGFALLGLSALGKGKVRSFVIWIAIGALFHKTAVLLLPIAALAASRNRILTAALVVATTVLLYFLLLADSAEAMWATYVDAKMESGGAAIRVAMNVVPAMLLILLGRKLVPDPKERKLWIWMAVFAFACVPLMQFASTAVDRVALYLIPLHLYVFARLPRLADTTLGRTIVVLCLVGYFVLVQFVWLNFANHAQYWVPYQFMPLT